MGTFDPLPDLEDFWKSEHARVLRGAKNGPRVARDTVLLLLEIAKELRALREVVLRETKPSASVPGGSPDP